MYVYMRACTWLPCDKSNTIRETKKMWRSQVDYESLHCSLIFIIWQKKRKRKEKEITLLFPYCILWIEFYFDCHCDRMRINKLRRSVSTKWHVTSNFVQNQILFSTEKHTFSNCVTFVARERYDSSQSKLTLRMPRWNCDGSIQTLCILKLLRIILYSDIKIPFKLY